MVVESAPNTLGILDDFWFGHVTDLGNAGPDRGQGGKFLILPPGYDGEVPDGYHTFTSRTFGNWLIWRGFLEDGDPQPAVANLKANTRIYPLAQRDDPPATEFVNLSGRSFNTIHANDLSFYEEVHAVIQEEPVDALDPEFLGLLAAIGIEKGRPFAPDARMTEILTDAAAVGNATARALVFSDPRPRSYSTRTAPGRPASSAAATSSRPTACACWMGGPLLLLRHRHHAGHGREDGRRRIAVRRRHGRLRGSRARWRLHLSAPHAAGRAGEGLLVPGALRQPDPVHAADRPAVPQPQQRARRRAERRWLDRRLLRPERPPPATKATGSRPSRQGLERHPAALRSARPWFDKTWQPGEIERLDEIPAVAATDARPRHGYRYPGADHHAGSRRDPHRHARVLRRLPDAATSTWSTTTSTSCVAWRPSSPRARPRRSMRCSTALQASASIATAPSRSPRRCWMRGRST
jgi:hypothetical protein